MLDYRPKRRRSRLNRRTSRLQLTALKNVFLWSKVMKLALFGMIALVVIVPLMFLWYSRDLPTPGKLVTGNVKDATRIYDRTGKHLLYSVYEDQNRTYVKLDTIAKPLQQATIAIEDKDFYENNGFSPMGYVRVVRNVLLGHRLAGASTITQQLVKNVLLSSERTLPRKIKELILAVQVNNIYSKDEILEMYLNNIPYGGTAVGIEAAAQTYFGKSAQDLDIAESAFLAGLPQSPSVYSPFTGNTYYVGRTEAVLKQMVEEQYITEEQKEKALTKIDNYKFARRSASFKAPHFVMYVKRILEEQFGSEIAERGGLQVTTTLDYDIQQQAEKIVKNEIEKLEDYKVSNGAAIVSDPKTGEILAMVGSKDYFSEDGGAFNVAVQGKRQPGSSLKPIIYAKAFEEGYTPATLLMDVRTEFDSGADGQPPYVPVNYTGKFIGPVQVRFALGNSLNIPAVKMLALVGIKDAMQLAYDMGITSWEPTSENMKNVGLSLVLGGRETTLLQEVTAYGVFANKGVRHDPVTILKIEDSKGKELFEKEDHDGEKVLSEDVAFLISHILLDNNARVLDFGVNSALRIPGKTVAVKTGTTDEKRDNWTIGYTPSYVVGVWVGNNDNSPMNQRIASGVTGASPIWHDIMVAILKDKPDEEFEKPDNVNAVTIDSFSGGLPVDGQAQRSEYFIKGTEPTTKSPIYQREFFVFKEDDPVSTDGKNRWQEGIDAWIEEAHSGDSKYHPPDDVKNIAKDEPTATPAP